MQNPFYKTNKWKHKRPIILRRDEYLCQECKRFGKHTAASTVHHIIPLAWCLMYCVQMAIASINLISLCEKCHNKMHNRDSDTLTAAGLALVRRIKEDVYRCVEKFLRGEING